MPVQAPSAPSSSSVGFMPWSSPISGGSSTTTVWPDSELTSKRTLLPDQRAVAFCIARQAYNHRSMTALTAELRAGELVLLHDRAGRRYQVRLQPEATFSLHSGTLRHDDLIGRPEGTVVTTPQGARLAVFRPTFAERVVERRRRAQPIYPKDLGA